MDPSTFPFVSENIVPVSRGSVTMHSKFSTPLVLRVKVSKNYLLNGAHVHFEKVQLETSNFAALVFSNVFYQGYLKGAFVSAIGVDYYALVAFFGIVFFGYIVTFLFGTMSRQARKKSKLWEQPQWKHQYMTEE